ncbi:MAG: carboxypeptidase-like regulatory domain-containing protein [Tepidisphaeraceae bacterium]|jgi:carboxypeptidase family protein
MFRSINSVALAFALFALAVFASHAVKADDSATSQPSASNGSITVTVVDSDSKPVAKASLKLYAKKKKSDSQDAGATPTKAKALASGRTDADGKFTFSGLASGDYKVNASFKKTGSKGSATVSVTDDSANPTITINLATADSGNGGATTAPTAQAQ